VRDVELPDAAVDLRGGHDRSAPLQCLTVNGGGSEAGNEDEDFRRIAERERLQGEIGQDVIGDVIEEDEDERETAKQIEPQIAPARRSSIDGCIGLIAHRKKIAMCLTHDCKTHDPPEPNARRKRGRRPSMTP
jgi:hypothetical protein